MASPSPSCTVETCPKSCMYETEGKQSGFCEDHFWQWIERVMREILVKMVQHTMPKARYTPPYHGEVSLKFRQASNYRVGAVLRCDVYGHTSDDPNYRFMSMPTLTFSRLVHVLSSKRLHGNPTLSGDESIPGSEVVAGSQEFESALSLKLQELQNVFGNGMCTAELTISNRYSRIPDLEAMLDAASPGGMRNRDPNSFFKTLSFNNISCVRDRF